MLWQVSSSPHSSPATSRKLGGVIVPIAVPLGRDEEIDHAGLSRLAEFLIDAGADGVFANGSMGSFALLPDSTQYQAVESVAELVRQRVPVLAGASDTSTSRVLEKMRTIETLGADYIVVLPPYYYSYGQKDLLRFYLTIADASKLPLMLYDNPTLTRNSLSIETIATLSKHPNIVGIKFSVSDVLRWQELFRAPLPRERFSLLSGAGKMSSLALQLGFDGVTEGLHNIVPDVAKRLYMACQAGNFSAADRLQQKINRCFRIFEIDGGWRGLETAFQYMGICEKATVNPFDSGLSEKDRRAVIDVLRAEEILRPYPQVESDEAAAVS